MATTQGFFLVEVPMGQGAKPEVVAESIKRILAQRMRLCTAEVLSNKIKVCVCKCESCLRSTASKLPPADTNT